MPGLSFPFCKQSLRLSKKMNETSQTLILTTSWKRHYLDTTCHRSDKTPKKSLDESIGSNRLSVSSVSIPRQLSFHQLPKPRCVSYVVSVSWALRSPVEQPQVFLHDWTGQGSTGSTGSTEAVPKQRSRGRFKRPQLLTRAVFAK